MALLNPWGLLALAALLLPLAIHLLSRSRGRRVLVGNIALYRQRRRLRVFEARIQEWPLLLLRLLLLLVAAILVAELAREQRSTLAGDVAYVTPEWLADQGAAAAAALPADQVRVLAPSFPPAGVYEPESAESQADLYGVLAERLAAVDHRGEVTVYALGTAGQFPIAAPGLSQRVRWMLSAPSTPTQTAPLTLSVMLYHAAERLTDAKRVAAALSLAAEQRQVSLYIATIAVPAGEVVTEVSRVDGAPSSALRVAIGLGVAIDPTVPVTVFADSNPGPAVSRFQLPGQAADTYAVRPALLEGLQQDWRKVLWRAENGQPVLVLLPSTHGRHLRYLDRLTMGDNALLASEVFPETLLRLLVGESVWWRGHVHSLANPVRALMVPGVDAPVPQQPLRPWLALLLAGLVALERWWSERGPQERSA